ncbi:MAG: hypothetical protein KGI80_02500 [Verrucomicrobiota bacterium]|nr:hypothetical protein [Verrucomicrobiota bacterium]
MNSTITTVENTGPSLVLRLIARPEQPFSYSEALNSLSHMLSSHREDRDWLSNRLIVWVRELIATAPVDENGDFVLLLKETKRKIEELFNKVFIHPDFQETVVPDLSTPPQRVLLEKEDIEVFSRRDLEAVLQVSTSCPCHGKQMQEYEDHPFAAEILQWISSLPVSVGNSAAPGGEIALRNEMERTLYYAVLQKKASSSKVNSAISGCEETIRNLREELRVSDEVRAFAAEARGGLYQRVMARIEEQDRRVADMLREQDIEHRQEMQRTNQRIDALVEEVAQRRAEVAALRERSLSQQAEIQALNWSIAAKEAEIARIRAAMDSDDGMCTIS